MNKDDDEDANAPDMERADRIKRLRAAKGWTQRELAAAIGMTVATVSHYERGKGIQAPAREALARALDSTPEYIRDGTPPNAPTLADLIAQLERMLSTGDRRSAGGMRSDFEGIAKLVAAIRGDQEDVSLSSLRADVRALTELVADLLAQLQEQGVLGEGEEPGSKTDTSAEEDPSTGTS